MCSKKSLSANGIFSIIMESDNSGIIVMCPKCLHNFCLDYITPIEIDMKRDSACNGFECYICNEVFRTDSYREFIVVSRHLF